MTRNKERQKSNVIGDGLEPLLLRSQCGKKQYFHSSCSIPHANISFLSSSLFFSFNSTFPPLHHPYNMPSLATSTTMLLDCTTDAKSLLSELSSAMPAIHHNSDPFPFVVQKQHQLDYIHQQQRIHQQQQRLLLYTQEPCRLQYLRFSNQPYNQSTVNEAKQRVDLVDDIWRLVAYILASDCKGLGRLMQVNRRLHK